MRNIRIEASACLWWAVLLLILPLRWLLSALFAGLFHELWHYLAIRLVGGEVEAVVIRPAGASMITTPLEHRQELICVLAGPAGSITLVCFARIMPVVALCALFQAVFNLLPIFPLDGGRALQCAMAIFCPRKQTDKLCRRISLLCTTCLCIGVLLISLRVSLGFGILFPVLILIQKTFPGKRPCKSARLALQ